MGTLAGAMILSAENVVDLQFFLMDVAKRYVDGNGRERAASDELLANAAALDYALLLSSQCGDEEIADDSAIATSIRDTMTRAANAALDAVDRALRDPDADFDAFVERYVRVGGLFGLLAALRERGVTVGDDLAFRTVTLANDLLERRLA